MPVTDEMVCFSLYAATRATTQAYRTLLEPWGLTYPQYLVLVTSGWRATRPCRASATTCSSTRAPCRRCSSAWSRPTSSAANAGAPTSASSPSPPASADAACAPSSRTSPRPSRRAPAGRRAVGRRAHRDAAAPHRDDAPRRHHARAGSARRAERPRGPRDGRAGRDRRLPALGLSDALRAPRRGPCRPARTAPAPHPPPAERAARPQTTQTPRRKERRNGRPLHRRSPVHRRRPQRQGPDQRRHVRAGHGHPEGDGWLRCRRQPRAALRRRYAACFHSALQGVARSQKLKVADSSVGGRVQIGPNGQGGYQLAVVLEVVIPGMEHDQARPSRTPHTRCARTRTRPAATSTSPSPSRRTDP